MRQGRQQTGHYLRPSVELGIAIALAVHDEGEAGALGNSNAAFNPVRLPKNIAP